MSVYVDDMEADFGRMIMCHMIADSRTELLQMAGRIGVNARWIQYPHTYREHFDICKSKRASAIRQGAIPISRKNLAAKVNERRLKQSGGPGWADAEQVLAAGHQLDPDTTMAPVTDLVLNLMDVPIGGTDVAKKSNQGTFVSDFDSVADGRAGILSDAMHKPLVAKGEIHQDAHLDSLAVPGLERVRASDLPRVVVQPPEQAIWRSRTSSGVKDIAGRLRSGGRRSDRSGCASWLQ
jgi:hypothetical protein